MATLAADQLAGRQQLVRGGEAAAVAGPPRAAAVAPASACSASSATVTSGRTPVSPAEHMALAQASYLKTVRELTDKVKRLEGGTTRAMIGRLMSTCADLISSGAAHIGFKDAVIASFALYYLRSKLTPLARTALSRLWHTLSRALLSNSLVMAVRSRARVALTRGLSLLIRLHCCALRHAALVMGRVALCRRR